MYVGDGCLGAGLLQLIAFCAKQRAEWAGGLERQSLQGTFRSAWESRVLLTVARASYVHVQMALAKLIPQLRMPHKGPFCRSTDPLLNAGVSALRSAPPSSWVGAGGLVSDSPFD